MLAPLFFLLAAATAPAESAEYPAREVLEAFATACSGAEHTAVNLASAQAAGWETLPADADTPISRLSRAGMAKVRGMRADGEGEALPIAGGEFRKVVAGRTLYLAISGVQHGEIAVRGCRLYDFTAPRAFTADELQQWSVREPGEVKTFPEGVSKITYNPGLKPGHMTLEVYFIPAGAKPLPGFDINGLSLIASAMEL